MNESIRANAENVLAQARQAARVVYEKDHSAANGEAWRAASTAEEEEHLVDSMRKHREHERAEKVPATQKGADSDIVVTLRAADDDAVVDIDRLMTNVDMDRLVTNVAKLFSLAL